MKIIIFTIFVVMMVGAVFAKKIDLNSKRAELEAQSKKSIDEAILISNTLVRNILAILNKTDDLVVAAKLEGVVKNNGFIQLLLLGDVIRTISTGKLDDIKKATHVVADELPRILESDLKHFEETAADHIQNTLQRRQVVTDIKDGEKKLDKALSPMYQLLGVLDEELS